MMHLFHTSSLECSRVITEKYSTSFFSAIRLLHKELQSPVMSIYGFVRLADEIVDTFHEHDKATLLAEFKKDTYLALERGISMNPILHSFQLAVNKYKVDPALIEAFFVSMEKDLTHKVYDEQGYKEYIYGSAEVVGLMCLCIFCEGNNTLYNNLKGYAKALGAAFQKVNFLRDLKADYNGLSRVYFPECDFNNFTCEQKRRIEADIQKDFEEAYKGILLLPLKARFGVYVAYKYYLSLFKEIKIVCPTKIMEKRIRIPDYRKALIVFRAGVKNQLRLI